MHGQHKDDDSDKATIDRTFGKLRVFAIRKLNDSTTLYGLAGSILDYQGDAMVNAANTGGVAGFGIDERVNRAGGPQLKQARRGLQGIPTGTCKSTPSFDHVAVQWIIHAVGPVLRDNALSGETTEAKRNWPPPITVASKKPHVYSAKILVLFAVVWRFPGQCQFGRVYNAGSQWHCVLCPSENNLRK